MLGAADILQIKQIMDVLNSFEEPIPLITDVSRQGLVTIYITKEIIIPTKEQLLEFILMLMDGEYIFVTLID